MPWPDVDPLLIWGLTLVAIGRCLLVRTAEALVLWVILAVGFLVVALGPLLRG